MRATAVTMTAVTVPVRLMRVISMETAVLFGIVTVFVFLITVVAAAPIFFGAISVATIVMTTPVFARGKAARHARGQQRRC